MLTAQYWRKWCLWYPNAEADGAFTDFQEVLRDPNFAV